MLTASDCYFDLRRQAVERLAGHPAIANMDVDALRRDVFADGAVTRTEADALFALERAAATKCDAWTPFFGFGSSGLRQQPNGTRRSTQSKKPSFFGMLESTKLASCAIALPRVLPYVDQPEM